MNIENTDEYYLCDVMQNLYDMYLSGRYSEFGLSYFRVNIVFTLDRMIKHFVLIGSPCICNWRHVDEIINSIYALYCSEYSRLPEMLESWRSWQKPKTGISKSVELPKIQKKSKLNAFAKEYVPSRLSYSL